MAEARGVADVDLAAAAFVRAAASVRNLDAGWESVPGLEPGDRNDPKFVTTFPTPVGPCLYVDAGAVPLQLLEQIPDILVAELAAAGVEDGVIAPAPYDDALWGRLHDKSGPAAVGWMFPPVFEQWGRESLDVPDSWLDLLCTWVVAHGARELALLLRRLSPPPAYAFIDMKETRVGPSMTPRGAFAAARSLSLSAPWLHEQRELGPRILSTRSDEFVFDAYPWQLLGPGHLRRLPQVVAARANALAEDAFELWLDDLPRWYPTHRDATQVRAEGRRALAECLPRERVRARARPTS